MLASIPIKCTKCQCSTEGSKGSSKHNICYQKTGWKKDINPWKEVLDKDITGENDKIYSYQAGDCLCRKGYRGKNCDECDIAYNMTRPKEDLVDWWKRQESEYKQKYEYKYTRGKYRKNGQRKNKNINLTYNYRTMDPDRDAQIEMPRSRCPDRDA